MRLKLEKLRDTQKTAGTVGTAGTCSVNAGSGCPHPVPGRGDIGDRIGAAMAIPADLSPLSPVCSPLWGHENPSVYAVVPAVPAVPTGKDQVGNVAEGQGADELLHLPESWEDELHQWAMRRCIFRERAWGGVAALHRDYVVWSHQTDKIPPATLATFRAWLKGQGFCLADRGMVYGLVLADDLKPAHALTVEELPTIARVLPMQTRRVQ